MRTKEVDIASPFDCAIREAIRDKHLIELTYRVEVQPRLVEPHDYGVQAGVVRLFAYQLAGPSRSGMPRGWRHFNLDVIASLHVHPRKFHGTRATASQRHQRWDVVLARVE